MFPRSLYPDFLLDSLLRHNQIQNIRQVTGSISLKLCPGPRWAQAQERFPGYVNPNRVSVPLAWVKVSVTSSVSYLSFASSA